MISEDEEDGKEARPLARHWAPPDFWKDVFGSRILDPDADEVLLGLLARDSEPIYKPAKPHRRWVSRPEYPITRELPDGIWVRKAEDWWDLVPMPVWRKERQLLHYVRHGMRQRIPVAEWLSQWIADPRFPDRRFPDRFFTHRGPWF